MTSGTETFDPKMTDRDLEALTGGTAATPRPIAHVASGPIEYHEGGENSRHFRPRGGGPRS